MQLEAASAACKPQLWIRDPRLSGLRGPVLILHAHGQPFSPGLPGSDPWAVVAEFLLEFLDL